MVMEYAPKKSIFKYLKSVEYFPEKIARRIFAQMLDSIEYLHKQGIGHRDVKIKNFVFDEEFNAKLCDFGSAGSFDPKTKGFSDKSKIGRYTLPDIKKQDYYGAEDLDLF